MIAAAVLLLHIATPAQIKQPRPPKQQPNAAVLYRHALKEAVDAIPDRTKRGIILPREADRDNPGYTGKAWRDAVRKTAVAISLFRQATQIQACNFDATPKYGNTELADKVLRIHELRQLVVAQAWQQFETDPRSLEVTAMQLLRHASHCMQDPSLVGHATGFEAEATAAKMLQASLKQLAKQSDAKADATRLLKQLEQHFSARPTRASLATMASKEFAAMLANGLGEAVKNPALKPAFKRALELHGEIVAPLLQDPTVTVKALRAHSKTHVNRLLKMTRGKQSSDILKNGTGETLAAVMVTLCFTDVSDFLQMWLTSQEKLDACQAELAKLAVK
ncbi:MAG: hypothetical protein ACI85K_002663 [Hyphomicrobiaceae bacterium]|jgi:hypothetical protein